MNFDGENMRRRGFRPIPDILIKWIKLRGRLTGTNFRSSNHISGRTRQKNDVY